MYIVERGEVIRDVHCGERGGYRGCTLWREGRL